MKKPETYFISAGEHSGDLLGADLVLALKEKLPKLTAFGVAGKAMTNAGVDPVASIAEFSVMGVVEVAKKLPELKMLESRLLAWVDRMQPKFAVLIDNPGFHIRFAEQLRMRGIKVFQYVAPKIWAWGEGRAPKLREAYTMILGILPFEEQFFKERHLPYAYVGSPLKDRIDKVIVTRDALGLPERRSVIACLPGSRVAELNMNLPTILAVRQQLQRELPDALFIMPISSNLTLEQLREALDRAGLTKPLTRSDGSPDVAGESYVCDGFRFVRGMSLEIMASADAAIVASGTATLECALLGTPMVVVYRVNEMTYQIAIRAVKVRHVSLVNLMAGRTLVKEYIQDFSIDEVTEELLSLLRDRTKRQQIKDSFEDIRDKLRGSAAENAAAVITKHVSDGKPGAAGS